MRRLKLALSTQKLEMQGLGLVLAGLSAVFNGSFASVFKLPQVASANLDPILFQLYVSTGVFLSSAIASPFFFYYGNGTFQQELAVFYEPLGLAAGTLFVISISFSFAAVQYIGVALGQGVWGGIAILVSYSWGVAKFGDTVSKPWLAATALLLLSIGVLGIAFCETLGNMLKKGGEFQPLQEAALPNSTSSGSTAQGPTVLSAEVRDGSPPRTSQTVTLVTRTPEKGSTAQWLSGMVCALCVGLSGGSILVPMQYVPEHSAGLVFVVSYGLGAMVASPVVCAVCFLYRREIPPMHLRQTLPAGLFSGLVYNVGNVLQILAIPMIGYSIAGPLLQCALFVAGIWGIFVFREIRGPAILVFFLGGAILLSGAVCLALSK